MKSSGTLAALLESFFTERLMNQRQASPHTISSYRDTFRLLLQFAQKRLHKAPAKLAFEEMDAQFRSQHRRTGQPRHEQAHAARGFVT